MDGPWLWSCVCLSVCLSVGRSVLSFGLGVKGVLPAVVVMGVEGEKDHEI